MLDSCKLIFRLVHFRTFAQLDKFTPGGRLLFRSVSEEDMDIKLLLEAIGGIVAVICLAVAAKALIQFRRLNRAAKGKFDVEEVPGTERKPMSRAS